MSTNLQLTFGDGRTVEFPFGPESTLTVETPDGVNGSKRGAWSEITGVELVDAAPGDAAPGPSSDSDDVANADAAHDPSQQPGAAPVAGQWDVPIADTRARGRRG